MSSYLSVPCLHGLHALTLQDSYLFIVSDMATTQDVGLLTRKLGAADYDPTRYVSEISQRCVGGEEILAQRKVIQNLSDDTNNQLKKNV